jgi:hypothetical protein
MALPVVVPLILIPGSCVLGVLFAIWLWGVVSKVHLVGGQVVRSQNGREYLLVRGWHVANRTSYLRNAVSLLTGQ